MKNEIYVFACPGMVSIIMLKQSASDMFQMVFENNEESDIYTTNGQKNETGC